MSRGLGKLQRELLTILEESDKATDTITLAADAYRVEPDVNGFRRVTDAQHAAVRRALCSLHRRGLVVELGRHRHRDNRRYWASLKAGLPDRLRIFQSEATGFGIQSSPARAAAVAAEIATIQKRMKQLGI
jgi:hypothetical protein